MKFCIKSLIFTMSMIIITAITITAVLYFTSSKYQVKNNEIKRVFIFHNELEKEIYEFTADEKIRLINLINRVEIKRKVYSLEEYTGGPWFSFSCEMKCGKTIKLYATGKYLLINSVPFEIDESSKRDFSKLNNDIEFKVLPLG